jgi:hypothetical protein
MLSISPITAAGRNPAAKIRSAPESTPTKVSTVVATSNNAEIAIGAPPTRQIGLHLETISSIVKDCTSKHKHSSKGSQNQPRWNLLLVSTETRRTNRSTDKLITEKV